MELAFSTNSPRIVVEVVSKDGGQSTVEAAGQATNPVHEERTLTSTEREKIDEGTQDVS